jgi:hypothetical protein
MPNIDELSRKLLVEVSIRTECAVTGFIAVAEAAGFDAGDGPIDVCVPAYPTYFDLFEETGARCYPPRNTRIQCGFEKTVLVDCLQDISRLDQAAEEYGFFFKDTEKYSFRRGENGEPMPYSPIDSSLSFPCLVYIYLSFRSRKHCLDKSENTRPPRSKKTHGRPDPRTREVVILYRFHSYVMPNIDELSRKLLFEVSRHTECPVMRMGTMFEVLRFITPILLVAIDSDFDTIYD